MSSSSSSSSSSFSSSSSYDEDSSYETILIAACIHNDVATVQTEIGKEENINSLDNGGNTILHHAVKTESIDVLKLLLKQPSIRKDAKDRRGCTPLATACHYNMEIDCILELIGAGCNLDDDDKCPMGLLMGNSRIGWEEKKIVIEAMIKNGVNLDRSDILINFFSCYDFTDECLEVLHLFLYYNIDVNANGVEALTDALTYHYLEISDILWDYVADFTINSAHLLIISIRTGYRFHELKDISVFNIEGCVYQIALALFEICLSKDANALERLNYLCQRFRLHDNISSFIEIVIDLINLIHQSNDYLNSPNTNRECVIRVFHLFFNSAFEAKCDLSDFFNISELYIFFEFIKLNNDEIIQMFYLFLMSTSRISYDQLFNLYNQCSKDLFEIVLKVTVNISGERNDLDEYYTKFDCILYPDLLPLDMCDEELPSLLKLSRNVIRKRFQPDYKTMIKKDLVHFRYYNEVNKLDIPKRLKDILLLNC